MSVILFYSPFDQRSRDTESLMIAFKREGHRVLSLSQASGAQIHDYLWQFDIETYTHIIGAKQNWLYYLRHAIFLVEFIRKHKVQVVYSHLEPANIAASIAQYFVNAKVYLVRHHIDEAKLQGFNKSWTYRITYKLAKNIIVVSEQAKKYMVEEEKVHPDKIIHINLAYDFAIYNKPDPEKVRQIRSGFEGITLLTVCRFTKYKRADVSIRTLKILRDRKIDARLILLGRGEEEANLRKLARDLDLTDFVAIPGYVSNVIDYLAASDFLVHPSMLESSCVTVKEAALVGLPVIVCKGVGDFGNYMENEKNGFVVDPDNYAEQAANVVSSYKDKDLTSVKESLNKRILSLFDIRNVAVKYQKLNEA